MRTFQQMRAFIDSLTGVPDGVWFEPGPSLPDIPGRFIMLTRYGGPGEHFEGVLDQIAWQVRVAGLQNDYDDAESIADAIDVAFLSIHSQYIDGNWVSGVQRVGGAPNPLLKDDAERTHFVCSYIIDTALALTH